MLTSVLIVDDDRASLYLAKILLEELAVAKEIISVSEALQGLELLRKRCGGEQAAKEACPDLILLDLSMPVMTGLEFLAKLSEWGLERIIQRTVVLTSSSYASDREQATAFGIKGYLVKPITEEKLTQFVAGR